MRILAIDLGKFKSVACVHDGAGTAPRFRKLPTSREEIAKLLQKCRPDLVVIDK